MLVVAGDPLVRGILVVAPVSMVTFGRQGAGERAEEEEEDEGARDDFEMGEVEVRALTGGSELFPSLAVTASRRCRILVDTAARCFSLRRLWGREGIPVVLMVIVERGRTMSAVLTVGWVRRTATGIAVAPLAMGIVRRTVAGTTVAHLTGIREVNV